MIDNFYALYNGKAPLFTFSDDNDNDKYRDVNLHSILAGVLNVPSGIVGAADPLVTIDIPLLFNIPVGSYEVFATVADVSEEQDGSHYRECYLSLVVSDSESVDYVAVAPIGKEPPGLDEAYMVMVDAGLISFFDSDAGAVANAMDSNEYFNKVEAVLADHPTGGEFGVLTPDRSKGNLVISHSGWGDGRYPLMKTLDAQGSVTGFHIDLNVIGTV